MLMQKRFHSASKQSKMCALGKKVINHDKLRKGWEMKGVVCFLLTVCQNLIGFCHESNHSESLPI